MNPAADHPYLMPPATDETAFTVEGKPIIGMIHVGALPGTPGSVFSVAEIVEQARIEARTYAECGVKCVMVENMHDVPYLSGGVGPEITAAMTLIAAAVKLECDMPVGIQILAGADFEALAVAHAAGLDFIRAECFAYAHVADEGLMQSNAAKLLRYRRQIGATEIQVWADIKKKHSAHAITADVSIGAMAEALEFMGADAVIVTGPATGKEPKIADVKEARERCNLPVFVGSGVRIENLSQYLPVADGVIIGSSLKRDGNWREAPDPARIRSLVQRAADILAFEAQAGPMFRV